MILVLIILAHISVTSPHENPNSVHNIVLEYQLSLTLCFTSLLVLRHLLNWTEVTEPMIVSYYFTFLSSTVNGHASQDNTLFNTVYKPYLGMRMWKNVINFVGDHHAPLYTLSYNI